MKYSFEQNENIGILTLKNTEVTARIAPDLKAQFLIVCQPEIEALIIDITSVEFIDSAGLGSFLLAYRQMKEHDAHIILVGASRKVRSLFEISHLEDYFDYYDTVDAAINDLTDESYCSDGHCEEC